MPDRHFKNLLDFAGHLRVVQRDRIPRMKQIILEEIGRAVKDEAKNHIIGRLTPLPKTGLFPAWAPLKRKTVKMKRDKGLGKFGNPNSMLYATGKFARSVQFIVVKNKVYIGSDLELAKYHEYGTIRMGPRPVFGPSMIRRLPKLIAKIESILYRTLCGERPSWR